MSSSNSNNISSKDKLKNDILRFKTWITGNNTIISNKSKITESVYNNIGGAYRSLNDYMARYRLIVDNEKEEAGRLLVDDDQFPGVFEDFVRSYVKWRHGKLFIDAINLRVEQINEFEGGMDVYLKKGKKKNKKKKKKKKHALGGGFNDNSAVNTYAFDTDSDDDDGDDNDNDDNDDDTNVLYDAFSNQHNIIAKNRSKRLAKRDQLGDTVCLVIQTYLQTETDQLESNMAYIQALFQNKNIDIKDIRNLNKLDWDLPGNAVFIIKALYQWLDINYRGAERAKYAGDRNDLLVNIIDKFANVSPSGLCKPVVELINVGTSPDSFKQQVLARWVKNAGDSRYTQTESLIHAQLKFVCHDYSDLNACINKKCDKPHICRHCGGKHITVECADCELTSKNQDNLRRNITYNNNPPPRNNNNNNNNNRPRGGARGRGGRGGGRNGRNWRNNNRNNYYNNNYNQQPYHNNNQQQPDMVNQFKSAFQAFMSSANDKKSNSNNNNSGR